MFRDSEDRQECDRRDTRNLSGEMIKTGLLPVFWVRDECHDSRLLFASVRGVPAQPLSKPHRAEGSAFRFLMKIWLWSQHGRLRRPGDLWEMCGIALGCHNGGYLEGRVRATEKTTAACLISHSLNLYRNPQAWNQIVNLTLYHSELDQHFSCSAVSINPIAGGNAIQKYCSPQEGPPAPP